MADNNHIRYIVGVEGFILRDDHYLMIERGALEYNPNTLAPPGGGLEVTAQEQGLLEDELRREIREEVGVEVSAEMHYLMSKAFTTDTGQAIIMVYFLCHYASGTPRIADPDEIAAVEWLTADQIINDPRCSPWLPTVLTHAEQRRLALSQ